MVELSALLGLLELHHQIGSRDEPDFDARLGRKVTQGDGEMRFTDAARTQEDDVLLTLDEGQGLQRLHDLLRRAGSDPRGTTGFISDTGTCAEESTAASRIYSISHRTPLLTSPSPYQFCP